MLGSYEWTLGSRLRRALSGLYGPVEVVILNEVKNLASNVRLRNARYEITRPQRASIRQG
jgi:hypothetical protein